MLARVGMGARPPMTAPSFMSVALVGGIRPVDTLPTRNSDLLGKSGPGRGSRPTA
jgi:hypothetical protein